VKQKKRKMAMVSRQVSMSDHNQDAEDLQYWLSKSPADRLACVTYLVNQYHSGVLQMDKTKFNKIKRDDII
jgi:hypothetical protein